MAGSFARKLRLQCCHLGLQLEHPANTGEGEPFLDEDTDLLDEEEYARNQRRYVP
jgi:hypothetical protein